jgi:hypothetical protein
MAVGLESGTMNKTSSFLIRLGSTHNALKGSEACLESK